MSKATVLASIVFALVSVVACSNDPAPSGDTPSNDSATDLGGCVDFVVTADDVTCTAASDCTFIDATHVCPGDPSCGGQIPTNHAGRARYDQATEAIPRTQVSCGVPSPEDCVAGRCVVSAVDGGAGG